jgi:hypothetical protein
MYTPFVILLWGSTAGTSVPKGLQLMRYARLTLPVQRPCTPWVARFLATTAGLARTKDGGSTRIGMGSDDHGPGLYVDMDR